LLERCSGHVRSLSSFHYGLAGFVLEHDGIGGIGEGGQRC
jgi:hypothetical protein